LRGDGSCTPRHLTTRRGRTYRFPELALRTLLGTVTLAIFLTPFLLSFRQAFMNRHVGEQVEIPAARLSPAQSARYAEFRRRVPAEAPILVSYRDIRPSRAGVEVPPDTVTTTAFATHLAMLKAAGYSTLSSEQLSDYLDGRPVPARSVVLTFDGGLQGSWVYVDRMLHRQGLRAVAFIPTARIGERRSRHLTWSQLRRMHASGRWDIESQGPDPDAKVAMAANGRAGGFYSVRAWLPGQRRRESLPELRLRIRRALATSDAAFARHGLPAPRFFGGVTVSQVVQQELRHRFRAVLADRALPSSVSRRDAATRSLARLAVRQTTTAAQLFRQLAQMTAMKAATRWPAQDPRRWRNDWNGAGGLRFEGRSLLFDSPVPGRLEARYAPQATEDWTGYAMQVDIAGFRPGDTSTSGGLIVLDGSPAECDIRVASMHLDLFCPAMNRVRRMALPPRAGHRLDVRVSSQWLGVEVDGSPMHRLRLPGRSPATGGVGLSMYRAHAEVPAPRFDRLRLIRLADEPGSGRPAGSAQASGRPSDHLGKRESSAG
jgi:biofilm PGA synthesis lipoprotein PgaB